MDDKYRARVGDVKSGLANYFYHQAMWRLEKADESDDQRNRRSGAGLGELAARVLDLADDEPIFEELVAILVDSGYSYLEDGDASLGEETDRVTSRFHFDDPHEDYYSFLDRFLVALKSDHEELLESA